MTPLHRYYPFDSGLILKYPNLGMSVIMSFENSQYNDDYTIRTPA